MNKFLYLAAGCLFLFAFVVSLKTLITNFTVSNLLVELFFLLLAIAGLYLFFKPAKIQEDD